MDADLEVYDYPGLYIDPKEGERLAQVTPRGAAGRAGDARARGGVPAPRRGAVARAPRDAQRRSTASTSSRARCTSCTLGVYRAHARRSIPKKVKYRTPQRTPRPIIDGPADGGDRRAGRRAAGGDPHRQARALQGASSTGTATAKGDDTASCWMRVSQQQTSGSMILPRVGWEVDRRVPRGQPRSADRHRARLQREVHAPLRAPRGQVAHGDPDGLVARREAARTRSAWRTRPAARRSRSRPRRTRRSPPRTTRRRPSAVNADQDRQGRLHAHRGRRPDRQDHQRLREHRQGRAERVGGRQPHASRSTPSTGSPRAGRARPASAATSSRWTAIPSRRSSPSPSRRPPTRRRPRRRRRCSSSTRPSRRRSTR